MACRRSGAGERLMGVRRKREQGGRRGAGRVRMVVVMTKMMMMMMMMMMKMMMIEMMTIVMGEAMMVVMVGVVTMVVETKEWLRMGKEKGKGNEGGEGGLSRTFSRPLGGSKDHQPLERDLLATLRLLCTCAVEDPECPETTARIRNKTTMRSCPPDDPEG